MMSRRCLLLLAALALLAAGCVELQGTALRLQSFRVSFSPERAQRLGSPDEPLPYISGRICGRTACQREGTCPTGEECVGSCESTGASCQTDAECPQRTACVKRCAARFFIDVEAIGNDGGRFDYEGPIHLDVRPGFLPPSEAVREMSGGVLRDVPVYIASASGRTNIWVQHTGYRLRSDYYGACNDGLDNDGNGLVDLADPGCLDEYDDLEAPVSSASGVSPDLHFERPDLRSIQLSPSLIHSALEGQDVRVDEGDVVITNVTNSGMYITDLRYQRERLEDGSPGYFNSVFLYTWATPEGVYQGDVLCSFSGGVVEFQGNTQLTFPSFEPFYPGVEACDDLRARWSLPETARRNDLLETLGLLLVEDDEEGDESYRLDLDALTVDVTPLLRPAFEEKAGEAGDTAWRPVADFDAAIDANSCALEPLESGLVLVRDVQVSTLFVECDQNQNGYIDDGDEFDCRNRCQEDPLCTELQSYERYKQWAGLVDGKLKMYVNQEMLLEQMPLKIGGIGQPDEEGRCRLESYWFGRHEFRRYVCPPLRYASVRGNLRQIYLCNKDYKEGGCGLQLLSLTPTGDRDVVPEEGP